jgi:dUTP pyrophosphatase
MVELIFEKINSNAIIPQKFSKYASGFDLSSCEHVVIEPGQVKAVSTGLRCAIRKDNEQDNYEIQVRPRSGLALKHGITVLNSPGTIDEDYRGEIKVILINHSKKPFVINIGDRIAQAVVCKIPSVCVTEGSVNLNTERGENGFGSTGI